MKYFFHFMTLMTGLLTGTLLTLSSCSAPTTDNTLVTTIDPLRSIVCEIAGQEWQVTTIVPNGFSPEDYSPTASQMADVADAALLFKVGQLGFETIWIPKVQDSQPSLQIINTSQGIQSAAFDPHTWTSPRNIKVIATNVGNALCQLDTARSAVYTKRMEVLTAKADSLDSIIAHTLSQLPSRTFIITHPALTHFAADYNLRQLAIEPDGKEPTPASVQALIAQAKADGARVVFVQQEFSDRSARMIASQIGAKVVSINPLSADWKKELTHIANSLKDAR